MSAFDDVMSGNEQYVERFVDRGLAGRAARGLAVLTCMDSRIDPLGVLGLQPGDAKILRNAGARVTEDVLRTLVLATYLLGVERVLVMPHTDCGMAKATDADVHARMAEAGLDGRSLEFRTVRDQRQSLAEDVQRIRSWPYLPATMPVTGALLDVRTGRLEVVVPD